MKQPKKQKKWVILLLLLFLTPIALACATQYMKTVTILDMIEETGANASCNITIISYNGSVEAGVMTQDGRSYSYNTSTLGVGYHTAEIMCKLNNTEFLGECKFKVGDDDNMIIGAIIIVPIILAIVLLVGAATLSEQHSAMKIGLFLLSILPFFSSLHFGMVAVAKYYDFPELQEAVGSTVYWVGIIFGVIITYFIIYLVYMMFHAMAQNKKERLEY
jgi:hypothetical protein